MAAPPGDAPLQVFLLMGQSNMAGRGDLAATRLPQPHVWMWRDGALREAAEPLHLDKGERSGLGLAGAFLELVRKEDEGDIAVIPAAWGGTPLSESIPGGELYDGMLENLAQLRAAYPHAEVAAALWHQGESDAEMPEAAPLYFDRFTAMVAHLRAAVGAPDLPVVLGELGPFLSNVGGRFTHAQVVRDAHAAAAAALPHAALVSAEGLTSRGDHIHFDTDSFLELGRRYYAAYRHLRAACAAL